MVQNAVAHLCGMVPIVKLNCAPFVIIYILYIAVTYAENFNGGFHSVAYGGHLYLVYAVCDVII